MAHCRSDRGLVLQNLPVAPEFYISLLSPPPKTRWEVKMNFSPWVKVGPPQAK